MVFVKTYSVLGLLDKKREEMMKEVAIIERCHPALHLPFETPLLIHAFPP